jgi:hypothetical protein
MYAKGKRAWGVCDRTGMRYKLSDLVPEFRNGQRTGLRVGRDVVDPDHPQNFLGRVRVKDPQSLRDPRPEQNLAQGRGFFGWSPVGHPQVFLTGVVGVATADLSDVASIHIAEVMILEMGA